MANIYVSSIYGHFYMQKKFSVLYVTLAFISIVFDAMNP